MPGLDRPGGSEPGNDSDPPSDPPRDTSRPHGRAAAAAHRRSESAPRRAGDRRPQRSRTRTAGSTRQTVTSRAGRNLPAAIGVGMGLGAVVLASLLLWRPAFLGVAVVGVVAATLELTRAMRSAGSAPPVVPILAG